MQFIKMQHERRLELPREHVLLLAACKWSFSCVTDKLSGCSRMAEAPPSYDEVVRSTLHVGTDISLMDFWPRPTLTEVKKAKYTAFESFR